MRGILLDTSAYSAAARGHADVMGILRVADVIVLCPIVVGELLAGFAKGSRPARNRENLDRMLQSSRVRLSEMGRVTAECYAGIFDSLRRKGTPIPENDLWIAASAMELGLELITLDRHFERVDQIRLRLVR